MQAHNVTTRCRPEPADGAQSVPREHQVAGISGLLRSSSGAVWLKPAVLYAHFRPGKNRKERNEKKAHTQTDQQLSATATVSA